MSENTKGPLNIVKKLKYTKTQTERALLVGVTRKSHLSSESLKDSLNELSELAKSAGAFVTGRMTQKVEKTTQYYVGKGKLEQLKQTLISDNVNTVICDAELTPTQQRNLENFLGEHIKVIDRTALILDVFATRAHTHEGRLQVELAQHEYLLPRLAGQWSHLERLGGGIGTRGPGETQIETDRRLVRGRIQRIKRELERVRQHRGRSRSRRNQQGMQVASLVGYTNAGKSSLLNKLTGAGVTTQNKLFTTLDPVTKRVRLPSGRSILFTDTVGFIQNLPANIIAAFRATLEEIVESTLLIHVVDIINPRAAEQVHEVEKVLSELNSSDKPRIMALNKIDLLENPLELMNQNKPDEHPAVFISASLGTGLTDLLNLVDSEINSLEQQTALKGMD